jgi:hypothetical protein
VLYPYRTISVGIGMSTGNWRVKPSEIIRVTKAVQSTGLSVRNVEVSGDGTIRVHVGEPDMAGAPDKSGKGRAEIGAAR